MLIWLLVIAFSLVSSVLVYSKRYTNSFHLGGLFLVQFYDLVIVSSLVFVALINIAIEISSRPEVVNIPVPTLVIFSFLSFFIALAFIGNAIHSTSASVSQAFPKGSRTKAYFTNEFFHKSTSHDMTYLGAAGIILFLGLLELNHPAVTQVLGLGLVLIFGAGTGVILALSTIWSTFIGVSLASAFVTSLVLLFNVQGVWDHLENYPVTVMMLSSALTILGILFVFGAIILTSKKATRSVVKHLFPKGHPAREYFHLY